MSGRLRTVSMAVGFLMIAYGAASALAPRYLTPKIEVLAVVVALAASALWNGGQEDDKDARFRTGHAGPPGRDYEEGCKEVLRSLGWRIVHTPRTRDRGADIYAIKGNVKLLIQCKDYKGLVRYKAVSEVKAAEASYPADHLCVIAPCDFSDDARRAARDIGVKLLHHDELRRYARSLA